MVALEVNFKDGDRGWGLHPFFAITAPKEIYFEKEKKVEIEVAGCLARRMGWWRWGEWKIGAPIQEGAAKRNRFNFNNWKEIKIKSDTNTKEDNVNNEKLAHQDINIFL